MSVQLNSLTTSSHSTTNQRLSIAVTKTTRSNWPAADLVPAVPENARPWEPCFVHPETVPVTVRCLLSRKATRLNLDAGQRQHFLQVLLHGAHADATSGGIKAAATTQPADDEGQERVGG